MNILNLNVINIRRINDSNLTSYHDKIHRIYNVIKQYRFIELEFSNVLKEKHKLVVNEIIKRDIDLDKTPLY